jgi:hypothetical protein
MEMNYLKAFKISLLIAPLLLMMTAQGQDAAETQKTIETQGVAETEEGEVVIGINAARSQPPVGNAYYQNDINRAIREAKQNRRNFNYANKHWYNRTTARSFDFDKLKNTELAESTIAGALDATASGPGNVKPEREDLLAMKSSDISLISDSENQEEDNSIGEKEDAQKQKDVQERSLRIMVSDEYRVEFVESDRTNYGHASVRDIRSKTTLNIYTHD